jgi:branched-chain amino acid transport system substrate-binding protein
MKLRALRIAAAIGLGAWLAPAVSEAQQAAAPVKIGAITSLTGALALTGQAQREGYLLAQKVINQRGGINGRPLQLILEDDASNPDTAVTKANSLLSTQNVLAILGPSALGSSVAVGGITSARNIPQIATAGIGLPIERERKCVTHMMPAQQINAAGLLAYATEAVQAKRVAVLHDSGFGQAVMNAMKDLAPQYGVNFVAVEKYDLTATDMSAQSAKVKAANPDLIFVISASPTPFRNLRQLRVTAPLITPIAAAVYETVKAMGEAGEGVIFVDFLVPEAPRPREKEFVDFFQAEYGKLPKNFEAAAWESVMLITKVMKQVGPDAPPEKICEALRTKHAGAHTDYDFSAPDMTGIKVSSFNYSQLVKGKFTRLPFTAKDRN